MENHVPCTCVCVPPIDLCHMCLRRRNLKALPDGFEFYASGPGCHSSQLSGRYMDYCSNKSMNSSFFTNSNTQLTGFPAECCTFLIQFDHIRIQFDRFPHPLISDRMVLACATCLQLHLWLSMRRGTVKCLSADPTTFVASFATFVAMHLFLVAMHLATSSFLFLVASSY